MTSPTVEDSPTDDDARAALKDGRFVAFRVAVSPSGNLSLQPNAKVFGSFGFKIIGDGNKIDNGLSSSDEGMIAPEWS